MGGPLEGVKVIEFGQEIQGPFAGLLLSYMGAQIYKVERREGGDLSRRAAARWVDRLKGVSPYFLSFNRGKRSITLDLKAPEAKEVVYRLAQKADVVISNFREGVLDRLQLGYDDLKVRNPRIIFAQASGFGPNGPMANRPARDVLAQAYSGLMSVTGRADDYPLPSGNLIGDESGGLHMASAVLAALYSRERTGKGQRVSTSIYGSLIGLQTWELTQYSLTGQAVKAGRHHVFVRGAWGAFKTTDGYLCLAGVGEDRWERFCRIVPGLAQDPRFTTTEARTKDPDALVAFLDAAFISRATREWIDDLQKADILCAPVQTYDDVLRDEQARANGYIQTMEHPLLGTITVAGPSFTMSDTPLKIQGNPPELGEHTEEILLELGYAWADIERLAEQEVT